MLRASALFYIPVISVFSLTLVSAGEPNAARALGAGVLAGLVYGLYIIIAGARAAVRAAPPLLLRGTLAVGVILCVTPMVAPQTALGAALGIALAIGASACLVLAALAGRAATMQGADW